MDIFDLEPHDRC